MSRFRTWVRTVVDLANRLVADRPASTEPPRSNWMPNSDGEGGRVISSGHPGSST